MSLSDKDELPPALPQDTFIGPHNTSEIASFIDMVFKEEMERLHVPGATISLVRDGEILYLKGYGLANAEQGLPVDPSRTPFFVASVSKLFTATAVMQLVEQGKLDLSEDVNHYLTAFKIDDNFPQPVTIANLLTHTGGFEERSLILAAFSKSDMLSREEYLTLGKQPRVLPPGRYISYSNYGYTLLGYLVEEVSGTPFEQYVDEQILGPLDMQSSSFSYPDSLMSRLAISHLYAQDTWKPLPVLYANVGPAGALISTASDVANFMIMHLQNGVFRDKVLMQNETAIQMHHQLFTQHPRLPGWCYGFYEEEINGRRLIQHGGDINNYASLLVLIPEENVGLFMVINGGKGLVFKFRENVLKRFMDHYYPSRIFDQSDEEVFYMDDIKRFSGVYRLNRYSRLSFEKILGAVLESRIKVNPDRSLKLILPPVLDESPSTWIRIDTLLFQNKKDGRYMVFYEDTNGHITHVNFSVQVPINAVRISWIHSGIFNLCLLIVILIVFLSVIPGWQIVWVVRKIRKRSKERDRWEKRIRLLIILVSGLNILFLIAFIIALITSVEKLTSDYPVEFIFVFLIPIIGTIFTLILTGSLFPVWKNRLWTAGRRIYYTGILLFMITFLWILHNWNFLGFHF
ncbi:MAG: hypothetical protein AMS27_12625 [Bacteroides sp. SM23_62_1]|nr:MAG: hypothetical protein AMS27_12625 [Bacteroides sp. SM23_62_1]